MILKKTSKQKNEYYYAVRDINLDVKAGEIFGFLGPITTLLSIHEREAYVAGFNVATHPNEVRRHIGYVSQKGSLDLNATGRENLLLQRQLYGMSRVDFGIIDELKSGIIDRLQVTPANRFALNGINLPVMLLSGMLLIGF